MFDPNQQVYPDRLPQIVAVAGVRLRADLVFTDAKGKDNNSQRKLAEKTLTGLQSILPRLMGPNEVVLAIGLAQGQIPIFERMFLGWGAYFLGRTCVVVTNRGLLRFRIRSRGLGGWEWDNGVQGIGWGDVAEARAKGGLSKQFSLRYRNNQKETFWRIPGPFGKKLQMLAPLLLNANLGEATAAGGPTSLCPKCLAPLAAGVYRCAQCGQEFRDEKKLFWRTLLIPGGEYFYVRQVGFGILQGLVELVVLIYAIVLVGVAVTSGGDDAGGAVVAAALMFLVLIFHKLAAYRQCRRMVRGFLPAN
ncbi:MAG: hypothetical protein WA871_01775 [Candidatus Acidiferrales bacterium]